MGAIWDFISGKSTDWDEVNRRSASAARCTRDYETEHPRPRRNIYYAAYCKICGEQVSRSEAAPNDRDPASAIRRLQRKDGGCGRNCHTPETEPFEW